jgi:hypothetical protein
MKNTRSILILIIAFITLYFLKDLVVVYWTIHNWYEIIASYFLYLLLPTLALGVLSFLSYKKDFGGSKKILIIGISVTTISVASFVVLLVNAFIFG